jgi:putative ATPase
MDLFDSSKNPDQKKDVREQRPLADRMRPASFAEFVGQKKLLGENSLLRRLISEDRLCSMIFWGPPGSGKTTLANIIAHQTSFSYHTLSAVTSGIKDIKHIMEQGKLNIQSYNRRTILFIDEIHRFNKAQQDAFLPFVEKGTIFLIGATTENPSFEVIAPLLSRCRVFVLEPLSDEELTQILENAIRDRKRGLGNLDLALDDEVIPLIIRLSDGDARRSLNLLDFCADAVKDTDKRITPAIVKELSQKRHLIYDKEGEEHFNLISALHKSLRSSDPDAALYWFGRMLAAGEDPLYIARRMIRFASEDIGNADPHALSLAIAARQAYETLGSPEGELSLAQAVIYLATSPKSNSAYTAYENVMNIIRETGTLPTPKVIRNAPTNLMKELGYGEGYEYDHDAPEHLAPKKCLPDELEGKTFYQPGPFGFEKEIKKRLDWWEKIRNERKSKEPAGE